MGKIIELVPSMHTDDVVLRKGEGYKPDFQIFTSGIESDRANPRLVHMVGSSTERDMQGDVMSLYALNDMTKAAPNMTIWLNHDYDLPDSIFGSVVGTPRIMQQDGVADLHLNVDVELDNPAAARVKRYIDNGRRLGCSIGCMVTKYEVPDESDGPDWQKQPITIHGVYVVEYSVVGIPCNQRSWVENAIRGVFQRTLDPALAPAMKSLWPSSYRETIKSLDDEKRAQFHDVTARPDQVQRLYWHAPTKKFFLADGKTETPLEPADVAMTLKAAKPLEEALPEGIVDLEQSQEETPMEQEAPEEQVTDEAPEEQSAEEAPSVEEEEQIEVPRDEIALPEHTLALLKSYNLLGSSLGLQEVTPAHLKAASHPVFEAEGITKAAPALNHVHQMHLIIKTMTNGHSCDGDLSRFPMHEEHANHVAQMHAMLCALDPSCCNGQSIPDAQAQASEITDQPAALGPMYNSLNDSVALLSKSVDSYTKFATELTSVKEAHDVTVKELEAARQEVGVLSAEIVKAQDTIAALKDMPLGNPVTHQRSVHEEDRQSVVRREDFLGIEKSEKLAMLATDSLSAALAMTEVKQVNAGGMFLRYRYWPAGVGGSVEKGVRPALTSNQIAYMDFIDIQNYRKGLAAKVPYLDNQVASGPSAVTE